MSNRYARLLQTVTPLLVGSLLLAVQGCNTTSPPAEVGAFTPMEATHTGIDFQNTVENTDKLNIFNYRNFYNGGGVAIGDINNDGLADVYFTGNLERNKLYLNKGNLQFEDITAAAGVAGEQFWSTGVVMVDINADGWLDIYVCNAGYEKGSIPHNELFINNQDGTFTEKAAEYGLDDDGYTTHAAFFDYDLDGDLDCYILNNSFIPVNTLNNSDKRDLYAQDWAVKDFLKGGGDKLLRNDGGTFTDVTREAGLYGSLIGFGLGITVGDINEDGYPDFYVSNDFFERDYLYINQQDGTFKEDIKNRMPHISLSSMGADMADVNNDGYPEIFVTEMLPSDEHRLKTTTVFENYNVYDLKLKRDFYHQYMHNTLQLNNQNNTFTEIAHYSGVAASDWSWGALLFDADNDGLRDIYVCNGIYHDLTNQDFISFFANDIIQDMALSGKKENINEVIGKMPSTPIPNKFFRNRGDLTFEDVGDRYGFTTPSFSNGAAYGDLDNDGDLDLVVNNVNQPAFIYRNEAQNLGHHYLGIRLVGEGQNTQAIGAKIAVHIGGETLAAQHIPTRGFQSSIDYKHLFGLGQRTQVDSLVVTWPDGRRTRLLTPAIDTVHSLSANAAQPPFAERPSSMPTLLAALDAAGLQAHQENRYVDFYQEGLVPRMLSREGPAAAVGDVNGDGLEDFFVGGAKEQAGMVYLQRADGTFVPKPQPSMEQRKYFEDTAAELFDVDGDGDLDLFVGSGGNEEAVGGRSLQDRIYLNDGTGAFELVNALPSNGLNTSVAVPLDYDGDGDLDLFVGSRSVPQVYGVPARSFLYENLGNGTFAEKANEVAPAFKALGMVTDAVWADVLGLGAPQLVVVGEWMSPKIFALEAGQLVEQASNLTDYSGWWYAVEAADVDGDGDLDLILGNRGENFYFKGSAEEPVKLWVRDFDDNGTLDKIMTRTHAGKDMPIPLQKELTGQIVSLKKQNLTHEAFANKSIQELFPEMKKSFVARGTYFKSAVALNAGDGAFEMQALPREVQLSCVCDIACTDVNGDGQLDLVMGGNFDGFLPQYSKLDGSYGHVLLNKGRGQYDWQPSTRSGYWVRGDVKRILPIRIGGALHYLTVRNNDAPTLHRVGRAEVQ